MKFIFCPKRSEQTSLYSPNAISNVYDCLIKYQEIKWVLIEDHKTKWWYYLQYRLNGKSQHIFNVMLCNNRFVDELCIKIRNSWGGKKVTLIVSLELIPSLTCTNQSIALGNGQ
jgi:hypothetical protein